MVFKVEKPRNGVAAHCQLRQLPFQLRDSEADEGCVRENPPLATTGCDKVLYTVTTKTEEEEEAVFISVVNTNEDPPNAHQDNQAAKTIAENEISGAGRCRHIDMRFRCVPRSLLRLICSCSYYDYHHCY